MKKKFTVLLLCSCIILTGCRASTIGRIARIFSRAVEETTETSTDVTNSLATPEPKETAVTFKQKAKIGNWEVTVLEASIKDSVKGTGRIIYKPASDGNKVIAIKLKVKNTGDKMETFLPVSGRQDTMNTAKLCDLENKEILPSQLQNYEKDFISRTINAGETKKAYVFFEVPKEDANKLATMTLKLGTPSEYLTCPLSL